MPEHLPEPWHRPAPALAVVSPPAVAGAGGGALVAALAGLPAVGVVVLAAVGGAAGVAFTLARWWRRTLGHPAGPAAQRINPYTLAPPWRDLVNDVLHARSRFAETAANTAAGPLEIQLEMLLTRVDTGVEEAWTVAQHGATLSAAVARLDPGEIRRQLALAQDRVRRAGPGDPTIPALHETVESVRAQLASAERVQGLVDSTRAQLQLLAARFGEAAAACVELALSQSPAPRASELASSVESIVTELASLRHALAEADAS